MTMVHVHVHAERPCSCPCSCRTSKVFVRVRGGDRVRVCVHVHVRVYKCRNAGLQTSDHSSTGIKKITIPRQVRYRTWHFLVRYWTEIIDAGMPMPALVSWMPMPSYGESKVGQFQ
jgi:hypothetical protein